MSNTSPATAAGSIRWIAVCLLSSTFHLSLVVLIVAAIETRPQGAGNDSSGEIGIVLSDNRRIEFSGRPVHEPTSPPAASPVTPADFAPETTPVAAPVATTSSTPRVAQAPATGRSGNYGPPGDGQTNVRVFDVEGKGSKFVYVFDRSSSMEGAPLAAAKQQLIQSLESLQSVHQFHIIFFNQQMRNFDLSGGGHRIAFATDRNKKLAARFVGGITADGGTDRFPRSRRDRDESRRDFLSDRRRRSDAGERAAGNRRTQSPRRRRDFDNRVWPRPSQTERRTFSPSSPNHRRPVRLRRHTTLRVRRGERGDLVGTTKVRGRSRRRIASCRLAKSASCDTGRRGAAPGIVAAELVVEPLEPRAADAPTPVGLHASRWAAPPARPARRRPCWRRACSNRSTGSGGRATCTGRPSTFPTAHGRDHGGRHQRDYESSVHLCLRNLRSWSAGRDSGSR